MSNNHKILSIIVVNRLITVLRCASFSVEPVESFANNAVKSYTKRTHQLVLDVWKDVILLGCVPPFRRPKVSSCQLVTSNKEVIDIPVGADLTCDDIIYNMSMLDNQNPSQLTGNYDVDFPDLDMASDKLGGSFVHLPHSYHPFKQNRSIKVGGGKHKSKSRSTKKIGNDFCFVSPSDAVIDNDDDVSEFDALELPREVEEWEIIEHPKVSGFELVHGEISTQTVDAADDCDDADQVDDNDAMKSEESVTDVELKPKNIWATGST